MTENELERIYNEAYKSVYWTAFSLLKNEADAEDIVQDTFVSFIDSYSGLTDTTKAVPLLKKIAANKSLNKLTRTRTVNTGDEFLDTVEATPEDFLPDSVIESEEMRKVIMDIIMSSLSDDIRRTLILFYFDEMSTKEIAEALDVPQGTVLRRLNFARNKIKKEVEKYEKDNDTKVFGMAAPLLSRLLTIEAEKTPFKPMPASLKALSASKEMSKTEGLSRKESPDTTKGTSKGTKVMSKKLIAGCIAGTVAVAAAVTGIILINSNKDKSSEPILPEETSATEASVFETSAETEAMAAAETETETSIETVAETEVQNESGSDISLIYGLGRYSLFVVNQTASGNTGEDVSGAWATFAAVDTGEGYELTGTLIVPNIIPAEGNAYLEDGVESFTNDLGMTYYVTDFYWTDAAESNPHPYYTLVDEAGNEYSMGYDLAPGMYWDVWGYRMFPNIVFEDVTIFVPYGAAPDDRAVEGNINELLNPNGVPANGFGIMLDEEGNLTDITMYYNAGFTEGDLNND